MFIKQLPGPALREGREADAEPLPLIPERESPPSGDAAVTQDLDVELNVVALVDGRVAGDEAPAEAEVGDLALDLSGLGEAPPQAEAHLVACAGPPLGSVVDQDGRHLHPPLLCSVAVVSLPPCRH